MRVFIGSQESQRLREAYDKTRKVLETWDEKWSWILKEQECERSKLTVFTKEKEEPDNRDVRPFPNSTNHEYGWLVSKPEFALQRWPDLWPDKPIPEIYRLKKDLY